MTFEKRAQKFHTDERVTTQISVELLIGWGTANQKHYQDMSNDTSSVWNFCAGFPDVISRGNQRWHRDMSAVFSGWGAGRGVPSTNYDDSWSSRQRLFIRKKWRTAPPKNCRPTVDQQSANCRSTVVYRLLRKSSAKSRPTVGRLSADSWQHVGNVNCWYTAGRQLADSIPTVGRQTFRGAVLHFYPLFLQLSMLSHHRPHKSAAISPDEVP